MSIGDVQLSSVNRLPVTVSPISLLGMGILKDYDLDIDGPNRTLTLYRVRAPQCDTPPWDGDSISGASSQWNSLTVPIEINGVAGSGQIDTGSAWTAILPTMWRRLGLTEQDFATDKAVTVTAPGIGKYQVHEHLFRTIRFGPVTLENWPVKVLPKDLAPLSGGYRRQDAIIGQDVLASHRMWFSYATERVFLSRAAR